MFSSFHSLLAFSFTKRRAVLPNAIDHKALLSQGGGGTPKKNSIGVCREGSRTLTLFKGNKGTENGYPF